MFLPLINDHIEYIQSSFKKNNLLISYLGFPISFILELSKIFPLLNHPNDVFSGNKIDLKKILENKREIANNILKKTDGINIITYEELYLTSSVLNLELLFDGQIIVFINNLFKEYPNQSNITFIDIEKEIESGKNLLFENEIFTNFYSNSSIIGGTNYIQYLKMEYMNNDIIEENFFNKDITNSELIFEKYAKQNNT